MTNEHDNQGAREGLVERLAEALIEEGAGPGNSIHGWRCEYPDRYGPCDCVKETADALTAAVLPLVAAQVEAAVSVVRAEVERLMALWALARGIRPTEGAPPVTDYETKYRALREGLEALANEVDRWRPYESRDTGEVFSADAVWDILRDLRALLAPSPAEGADKGRQDEIASLKHARDCSDIRRFGECHLPFDEQGQHVTTEPHSPEKVLTSGSFQFVQCACTSASYPTTHVWVAEHFAGSSEEGWETLEALVRRQGGLLPLHVPAPVSSGEAGEVDLNESNDSPGWRDYRNWVAAGRPKDWVPGTTPTVDGEPLSEWEVDLLNGPFGDAGADVSERCRRCAGPNVIWAAASPLWNYVMRGNDINGPSLFSDLVCMPCFVDLAVRAGLPSVGWRLTLHPEPEGLIYHTPSGRVWDARRFLWVEACPTCRSDGEAYEAEHGAPCDDDYHRPAPVVTPSAEGSEP